jgi:adenylate cyclase
VLGISIPLWLAHHLVVTRIDLSLYGTQKGYAQELYSFWVASPFWGTVQVILLVVVWTHGCLGLYFWLRLRTWFARAAPILLSGAILLPSLALLGFFQGGRSLIGLAQDPSWRAVNLAPEHAGTPAENGFLDRLNIWIIGSFMATIAIVFAARAARAARERRRGFIRLLYPNGAVACVPRGFSILEASLRANIPHASICGGRARCSTCRIRVIGEMRELPPPGEVEQAVLRRIRAGPSVRLACQLRPLSDLAVVPLVPAQISLAEMRRRTVARGGQERYIVVLVVDLRGSTQLPLRQLPFDAVFAIGCFVEAVGRAIAETGGQPNQFTGDGLLAMFGIDCAPAQACRAALHAAAKVGANVAELNAIMAAEWPEPIRFGIGIYGGEAIVGEIGYRDNMVFTAVGDPANLASRLEDHCKAFGCEAVIADAVCRASGLPLSDLPLRSVVLPGRSEPISVRTVERAADLAARSPVETA